VFLYTQDNRHLLARVPSARVADPDAYEYWDGVSYSRNPRAAAPIWDTPAAEIPLHNGASVMYSDALRLWLAVYNADLTTVEIRTAERVEGPWDDPERLFDCRAFFPAAWPVCYSAEWHAELTRDAGRTLYLTIGSRQPYDVWLFEVALATTQP
jgi:hypothetical protein